MGVEADRGGCRVGHDTSPASACSGVAAAGDVGRLDRCSCSSSEFGASSSGELGGNIGRFVQFLKELDEDLLQLQHLILLSQLIMYPSTTYVYQHHGVVLQIVWQVS